MTVSNDSYCVIATMAVKYRGSEPINGLEFSIAMSIFDRVVRGVGHDFNEGVLRLVSGAERGSNEKGR